MCRPSARCRPSACWGPSARWQGSPIAVCDIDISLIKCLSPKLRFPLIKARYTFIHIKSLTVQKLHATIDICLVIFCNIFQTVTFTTTRLNINYTFEETTLIHTLTFTQLVLFLMYNMTPIYTSVQKLSYLLVTQNQLLSSTTDLPHAGIQ